MARLPRGVALAALCADEVIKTLRGLLIIRS